jgi:hypothetical protein
MERHAIHTYTYILVPLAMSLTGGARKSHSVYLSINWHTYIHTYIHTYKDSGIERACKIDGSKSGTVCHIGGTMTAGKIGGNVG